MRKGCKSHPLISMRLSQVQTLAFSPLRGNYSSCVAWRQWGLGALLLLNTTQVAVNPLALIPDFLFLPPASPHQRRDRNQTKRNLLDVFSNGMENKGCSRVFAPSLLPMLEWGRRDLGQRNHSAARLGLRHERLKTSGL